MSWVYTKQHGRLPPAFFAPFQFGNDAMLRDENVFLQENTFSSAYFLSFFKRSKFSVFFPSKPHKEGWKTFRKYYRVLRFLRQICYF